ncbi:hypothetical protein WN944_012139 [Citrus x changshan-huyou]|uniref:Uncharacterized protein n=1 Tax=Citrus x changshan-huyou TaxID=2935761 RepID=A0AAP0QYR9_9ROSI
MQKFNSSQDQGCFLWEIMQNINCHLQEYAWARFEHDDQLGF